MGACLIGVVVRQREDGKEGRDTTVERAEAPANKDKDADAEDPETHDSGKARRDQAFAEQVLSPAREEIEERRVEVRSTVKNGSPCSAEAREPTEQDSNDLVVPEGLQRGSQERVREVEGGDQQECDHYHVAGAASLRSSGVRAGC